MHDLINGMLDLARIDAGKMVFHPTACSLRHLLDEVCSSARVLSARKQHAFKVEIEPGLDAVTTDALRLKQVLLNFVTNAVKFTPEHGAIVLRARREGEAAFRVEVEDSGVGIPAAQLRKLFVEFERLERGTEAAQAGTGLGLALGKRIVEALGGYVGVSSTMGKGSVFYAVVPTQIGNGGRNGASSPKGPERTS